MSDRSLAYRLSQRAQRTGASPISYLMAEAINNPGLISLAAGFVDNETLPSTEAAALFSTMLTDTPAGHAPLQYGSTQGLAPLRTALLEHLAALDGVSTAALNASPDDIILTNGSQQLLFILTDVLVDPGDIVICQAPSYFVYTGLLETFGAEVRTVEGDEHGVIPDQLDALLAALADSGDLPRVKIVYVVDYHDNPSGLTLSAERRPELLRVVQRYSAQHRILLLEDAAYRELTYDDAAAPPSIRSFDTAGETVALLQTFSKPFAPGIKLGYGLLPRDLMGPALLQKGGQDFGSSHLAQHLALAALRTGVYASHVRELCQSYAIKRDAMLDALQRHLGDFAPGETTWTKPQGGLYVWLTLPRHIDTGRDGPLFSKALAEGVLYVPGEYCYGPDPTREPSKNQMRLSFGVATAAQIEDGIQRLARAVKATAAPRVAMS